MSYTIRLLPVVRQDLQGAKKWYNDQKAHLGEGFKLQVNKEIDYIEEFPEHYQRRNKELPPIPGGAFSLCDLLFSGRGKEAGCYFWGAAY